jgi:hypothetical protein
MARVGMCEKENLDHVGPYRKKSDMFSNTHRLF